MVKKSNKPNIIYAVNLNIIFNKKNNKKFRGAIASPPYSNTKTMNR
jgi:hypothetical protein